MLFFQLFQHIRIGGIAGFGFFHRGQSQLFKKQIPQLFGRINVKSLPGVGIDQCLTVRNSLGEHISKLLQLLAVNGNAPVLHLIKHITQGKLYFVVKLRHPVLFQFFFQNGFQEPNGLGAACRVPILHIEPQQGGGELGHRIIRLGRI